MEISFTDRSLEIRSPAAAQNKGGGHGETTAWQMNCALAMKSIAASWVTWNRFTFKCIECITFSGIYDVYDLSLLRGTKACLIQEFCTLACFQVLDFYSQVTHLGTKNIGAYQKIICFIWLNISTKSFPWADHSCTWVQMDLIFSLSLSLSVFPPSNPLSLFHGNICVKSKEYNVTSLKLT